MQHKCTYSVWVIRQVNFSMDDKSELKDGLLPSPVHIAQSKQAKEATMSQMIMLTSVRTDRTSGCPSPAKAETDVL